LLHDVGKLAVPEHILAKPGRLTPEEFAKMKIHPVVGAEIVEQVKFPYPVAPIVRAHHEKWDGSGYPLGLKGGAIPLGARILTAVDCLDALTSDREYRRALSYDDAMTKIRADSGKSFDPQVVEVLGRRYRDLEQLAEAFPETGPPAPRLDASSEGTPGAGFDLCGGSPAAGQPLDFLSMISAARSEDRFLLQITESLGASLDFEEMFTRVGKSIAAVVPHHAFVFFLREANTLRAQFASGSNSAMLPYLEVPMGTGLAGWVAENATPVVNGNPAVDPDFVCAPDQPLRSALAIPLEGPTGVLGVLALYHRDHDGFTREHLRLLLGVSSRIAQAVENTLKYRDADQRANRDALTGLPNSTLLAKLLKAELTRARRLSHPLAVITCDLAGLRGVYRDEGLAAGDQLVQRVAHALQQDCRTYDHLGRVARQQFAFILPGMKPEVLAAKLSRLNGIAHDLGLSPANSMPTRSTASRSFPVSFRIGQAFYPDDGDSHGVLLEVAQHRAANHRDTTADSLMHGSQLTSLQDALKREEGAPDPTVDQFQSVPEVPERSYPENGSARS
jgi:diguanylate cyclase (GGDEF)-like protein